MRPIRPLLSCLALALPAALSAGETPIYDLIERFAAADAVAAEVEVVHVDIGTRPALAHLVRGWGRNQRDRKHDVSFAWGLGAGSEMRFEVPRSRALRAELRCRPYPIADQTQRLTLILNGQTVTTLPMRAGWSSYDVALPATAVRAGDNRLELSYSHHREPGAGRKGQPPLAVAWDELRLTGANEPPRIERGQLRIPAGARVAYYPTVTAGARLELSGVRGSGTLRVHHGQKVETVKSGGGEATVRLAADGSDSPPLELRADGGEVVVERARVHGASGPSLRPNIIVYLVDTLRADHLGCYGYDKPTSPHLDRFAETSVLFDRAVAHSPWTRTSVASLLTGLYPTTHRVNDRDHALPDDVTTLAERLSELGYVTAAITTNGNVSEHFGFGQGYDEFEHLSERLTRDSRHVLSDEVNETVFTWLRRPRSKPFFLYVHTCDPHGPYTPPEPYLSRLGGAGVDLSIGSIPWLEEHSEGGIDDETLRQLIALYDGEVALNDASFGALIDELRELGLYDSSLIAFTSDHGEEFLEHGQLMHGKTVYAESIDVPFVIKFPHELEIAPRRIAAPVQHADFLPTVLETVGLAAPAAIDGLSLMPLLDGGDLDDRRVHASVDLDGRVAECSLDPTWKLIRTWTDDDASVELFDAVRDRADLEDLARSQPEVTRQLLPLLDASLDGGPLRTEEVRVIIDRDLRERLRAVGYMH